MTESPRVMVVVLQDRRGFEVVEDGFEGYPVF